MCDGEDVYIFNFSILKDDQWILSLKLVWIITLLKFDCYSVINLVWLNKYGIWFKLNY